MPEKSGSGDPKPVFLHGADPGYHPCVERVVPNISDQRLQHLDFIQAVVTCMAGNSMTSKSWSVVLTTAIVGLASAEHTNPRFVLMAWRRPSGKPGRTH